MSSPALPSATDATRLLMQDHREVEALFDKYDDLVDGEGSDDDRMLIAQQICVALTVHAQVEEELFYPASRDVLAEDEQDVVDEAYVEHAGAKRLIAELKDATPDAEYYDAKVKVLGEYIRHHVKEEENEYFPLVRETPLGLEELGARIAQRKEQLMARTEAPADA